MGWNIEVACMAAAGRKLHSAVPDVFAATKTKVIFEDASSVMRGDELSVAKIGDWFVVIDVGCRLSGNDDYLAEASSSGALYVFRVADAPLELYYLRGKQKLAHRGLAACLRESPRTDRDGELVAWDLLTKRTGLTLSGDLFDAKFTVFELP